MTDEPLFPAPAGEPRIPDDVTLSARVPREQRARVIAEQHRAGDATLSDTVRRLLNLGLNRVNADALGAALEHRAGGRLELNPLGSLDTAPPSHSRGPATEKTAAAHAWPRAGTKRRELLGYVYAAGDRGVTSDEATTVIGYSGQRRLHDLKAGGWVEVLTDENGQPVRRNTRRGAPADVYVLTPAARAELRAETIALGRALNDPAAA